MENDAPTAAGPTPDSEENNNANEKESPGPSTVESTSKETGDETEERFEKSATPKSDISDVTAENSGDVTVGSKLPEEEDSVTEQRENETVNIGNNTEEQEGDRKDQIRGDGAKEVDDHGGTNKQEDKGENHNDAREGDQPSDVTPEGEGNAPSSQSNVDETVATTEEVYVRKQEQKTVKGHETQGHDSGVEENHGVGSNSDDVEKSEEKTETKGESENTDTNDTVSAISKVNEGSKVEEGSKHDDGYSADNEVTTLASVDTGEASQSGMVLEQAHGSKEESVVHAEVKVQAKEEQPPLSYDDLVTKYHATELQLDGLKEENNELIEKIKALENEIQQLREGNGQDKAKQSDGYRVQGDVLARELSQTQDAEHFLKVKVAELLEEKEEGEKKVRDLQLRLKRFVKDDKAKDERISKMETELKEITEVIQELETYVDEETRLKIKEKRTSTRQSTVTSQENSHTKVTDINKMNTNRSYRDPEPVQRSRTCIII